MALASLATFQLHREMLHVSRFDRISGYDAHYAAMKLFQAADALALTGLTRHQLREWSGRGRRNLIAPDVEAAGPGRHALYSWQTLLVLRVLRALHEDYAAEVGAWAPAINELRDKLDGVSFPSLWRAVVHFPDRRSAEIVTSLAVVGRTGGVLIPLEQHLEVLSAAQAGERASQLNLFPAIGLNR